MLELTEFERKAYASLLKKSAIHQSVEKDVILDIIVALETKYYRKLGKPDLKSFIIETLNYDSNSAYHLSIVARRAQDFSQVRKALFQKRINVGKVLRIGASLTKENANELVEFARTQTFEQVNAKVREEVGNAAGRPDRHSNFYAR